MTNESITALVNSQGGNEAAQFVKDRIKISVSSADSALEKTMNRSRVFWRTRLLQLIQNEPNLTHYEYVPDYSGFQMAKRENLVYMTMESFFWKGRQLNYDDLKIVQTAMRMDLRNVINWNKTDLASHIYPNPTPYHHKAFDEKFWKDVSSRHCYIDDPL